MTGRVSCAGAIVHIGTPRSGTTTLQRIFADRRAALAAAGILYPDLTPVRDAEPHLSHQLLGEALAGRRPARERRELLDLLEAQLAASPCDTVLISYEALCRIPASFGAAQTLAALFARHGMAMETLLTLKPQVEYLNSTYTWRMQFLREERIFASFLAANLDLPDFDLARLVAPWRRASADRLTAVPLRDPRSSDGLVDRVADALGLAQRLRGVLADDDRILVENRSPGPVAIEVCRRLRAEGAALWLGGSARAVSRFVERAARTAGADAAPFCGFDAASRARLAARWASANERFAALAWGEPWARRVGSAPPAPVNDLARETMSPETEALVRDILRQTHEAFGFAPHNRAMVAVRRAADVPLRLLGLVQRRLRMLTGA